MRHFFKTGRGLPCAQGVKDLSNQSKHYKPIGSYSHLNRHGFVLSSGSAYPFINDSLSFHQGNIRECIGKHKGNDRGLPNNCRKEGEDCVSTIQGDSALVLLLDYICSTCGPKFYHRSFIRSLPGSDCRTEPRRSAVGAPSEKSRTWLGLGRYLAWASFGLSSVIHCLSVGYSLLIYGLFHWSSVGCRPKNNQSILDELAENRHAKLLVGGSNVAPESSEKGIGLVRDLFGRCSSGVRRYVEAQPNKSRRLAEGVSKVCRTSLEEESKSSRRTVEQQPKDSRRDVEIDKNVSVFRLPRTKVELALTQAKTKNELGMNYQRTRNELASVRIPSESFVILHNHSRCATHAQEMDSTSESVHLHPWKGTEMYSKATGKVLKVGGKGTGEVLESYQTATKYAPTASKSAVDYQDLGEGFTVACSQVGKRSHLRSEFVGDREAKSMFARGEYLCLLILSYFKHCCKSFNSLLASTLGFDFRHSQIALKYVDGFVSEEPMLAVRPSEDSEHVLRYGRGDGKKKTMVYSLLPNAYGLQLIASTIIFCVLFSSAKAQSPTKVGAAAKAQQQEYVVRGVVHSSTDGKTIEGVSISTNGKHVRTAKDGTFSITTGESLGVVKIKHLAYKEQSVAYDKTSTYLTIVLQSAAQEIQEVEVVSTGYQKIPKERATGSFEFVDNKALNQTISGNIIDRIELQVPGLLVDKNEGAPDKFLIRGRSSIFADVQPLIVLDGFPYDGEIGNINPNDIESVTVLKDAAVASIWGARAGNGVIVITTKRAMQDRPTIGFSSTLGIQNKPDLSTVSQISSTDYIELEKFLFEKGHYTNDEQYDEWNYGHPPFTPVVELLRKKRDGGLDADYVDKEIEKLKQYDVKQDIRKNLYRVGFNQQYALNLGQRVGNSNYMFSSGYDNSKSNLVGHGDSRLNMRFNMSNNLFSWLQIDNALSFVNTKSLTGNNQGYQLNGQAPNVLGGNKSVYPYARLLDDTQAPTLLYLDNNEAYVQSMLEKGLDWSYSPLDEINRRRIEANVRHISLNTGVQIRPFSDIQLSVKYQFQDQVSDNNTIHLPESYYARAYSNSFAQVDAGGKLSFPVPQQGIWDGTTSRKRSHQGRIQGDWNKKWSDQHELNLLGGWEIRNSVTLFTSDRKYGYNEDFYGVDPRINYDIEYTLHNNSFLKQQIISNNTIKKTTDNFISLYFNGAYTYRNRYHLSFSGRKDEANLFGLQTNQKGTPLWSVGTKWNISDETFYHSALIPKLALRATYGKSGNIARNASAIPTITLASSAYTTPLVTASLNGFPNYALRWEKVNVLNLGLDFSFINNRLQASVDYFDKVSEDLLGESPLDPTLGRTTFFGNVAKMHAKGVDFRVNAKIIDQGIDWDLSFIYGYSNPKISDYYMPVSTTGNTYLGSAGNFINPVLGKPVFARYGLKWEGLNPENGNPIGLLGKEKSEDYTNIYAKTAFTDLTYHGSVQPTTYGSITNTFRYKRISMAIALSYKAGYVIRKPALSYTNLYASWTGHGDYAVRWQRSGDERVTDVPSLLYPANISRDVFYQYADIHILRGDHIRLENIRIDYDLPLTKVKGLPFRSMKCFIFMKSYETLWASNNKGIDPYFINSPRPGMQWSFGLISNL